MKRNAADLESACNWLHDVISGSLDAYFKGTERMAIPRFVARSKSSSLSGFLARHTPSPEEFVVVMLALVPHLRPGLLRNTVAEYLPEGGDFPEFGCVQSSNRRGILPTGETAQFILAGAGLQERLAVQKLMGSGHWFAGRRVLWLEPVAEGEPLMSGRLVIDPEIVEELTTGAVSRPAFGMEFPAQYIETEMEWEDLVLHPDTLRQIREIERWIKHKNVLLKEWGLQKKLARGYRALFHGPPGTGKTLTATLLGKCTGRDVFRIDLSRVVSKYIGETEKNLSKLFEKAENKEWILFFDEADALFGKRTDIRDAHDKYANQEVAYLLQRIECYDGLVILATNQRGNVDDAFIRRFQTVVHFPMPRPEERHKLWCKAFPPQIEISREIDWRQVAARFELPGAGIMNVTQFCALEVLADQSLFLDPKRLEAAILREYVKEGKVV